jgi:protein-tyrosine-phosphatase
VSLHTAILCSGNSARSQMAEALTNAWSRGVASGYQAFRQTAADLGTRIGFLLAALANR